MKAKTYLQSLVGSVMLACTLHQPLQANDQVFFVNGSSLTPIHETDIAVQKEVLTIQIGDDGFAHVVVDYQFYNTGNAKTVTVGFEAQHPSSTDVDYRFQWGKPHPHIRDFSVVMNGKKLPYNIGCVSRPFEEDSTIAYDPTQFPFLNPAQWRTQVESDPPLWDSYADGLSLFNPKTKEYTEYAYVYHFQAHFQPGMNTVRHTYRYRMSLGVGTAFRIPYWLTPAMNWANHQIDDFTLRIVANNTTKHFFVYNDALPTNAFRIVGGQGKMRTITVQSRDYITHPHATEQVTEVVLRNATLEWHALQYHTDADLEINSADDLRYMDNNPERESMLYYDSGNTYCMFGWYIRYDKLYTGPDNEALKQAFTARIRRNLPYAHRGYVFKDKELRSIFEKQWWYMPDPTWKPQKNTFSSHEQQLINNSDKFDTW
ncbi:MAG: YARHG domain-containing protein [Bacteroidaceae bacterium]|nr:YARHG domain-containing protein [Bacteroidaceae bacterium]